MKRLLLALLCVASSVKLFAQDKGLQLDSLVNYYATQDNYNGVVLVTMKDKVLLNKSYGYRDIAKGIKHDEHSIFQIGSLTKQFTAEVILQLANEGKLKLDDNIGRYFKGYPNSDKITIHHLLTHSSGIYNYTNDSAFAEAGQFKPITREQMLSLFRDKPINFEPGSQFAYSNSNYVLLGYIIEDITGKDYDDVIKSRIFKPAGMKNSGFDFKGLKDKDKSIGYDMVDGANSLVAPVTEYSASFSAGAMYATAEDLNRWHDALQNHKLLPKEWQDKAYIPNEEGYGYGWLIDTIFDKRVLGHGGGISGFTSYILRVEEDDLCIVMLENSGNPSTDKNNMVIHILSCLYSPEFEMPVARPPVKVPKNILQEYVGSYTITDDFILNITVAGESVFVQATGQPKIKIVPQSETEFYSKVVDARIEFVRDDSGKVSGLVLHQSGRNIPAERK